MNKHTLFKCLPVLLFAWCILDADMVFAQKAKRKGKENIENNVQKQRNLSQAEYYFAEGMKFYVLENYIFIICWQAFMKRKKNMLRRLRCIRI
jgi:hypothetical protein